jgi:hypothetical protein
MNTNTATRQQLIRYLLTRASEDNLEEWAEGHLGRAYSEAELRDMVREINEYGEVRGDYDGD